MVERGRRDGKEDEEARRRTRQEEEEKEAEEEEKATDIKSNNPHLAGGEKINESIVSSSVAIANGMWMLRAYINRNM